jgi:hypothetical protein
MVNSYPTMTVFCPRHSGSIPLEEWNRQPEIAITAEEDCFVLEIVACGIRGVGDTLVDAIDQLSQNVDDYRLHFLDEPDENLAPDALRIKRWLEAHERPEAKGSMSVTETKESKP